MKKVVLLVVLYVFVFSFSFSQENVNQKERSCVDSLISFILSDTLNEREESLYFSPKQFLLTGYGIYDNDYVFTERTIGKDKPIGNWDDYVLIFQGSVKKEKFSYFWKTHGVSVGMFGMRRILK